MPAAAGMAVGMLRGRGVTAADVPHAAHLAEADDHPPSSRHSAQPVPLGGAVGCSWLSCVITVSFKASARGGSATAVPVA